MTFNCCRCGESVKLFSKTKTGNIYCWKCWNDVMDYVNKKNNGINSCTMCNNPQIFWTEEDVFIKGKVLQLCKECYEVNIKCDK